MNLNLKKKKNDSFHITMESLSLKEEKIIKDIRNLSRRKKRTKVHRN